MEIRKILCPVDFSEFSRRAVRYGIAFAQQYHSRLLILHSITPLPFTGGFPEGAPAFTSDLNEKAKEELDKFLSSFPFYNIDYDVHIIKGEAATQILTAARRENVDLIVMGTHGLSGYEAILMGSVTNKVLHKALVPVLAVCTPTKPVLSGDPNEPLLIGKILCAVDPDNVRLQMLSRALFFARSNRATIYFLSVGESAQTNQVINDLRETLAPEKEESCAIQFLRSEGDPVEEILKTIRNLEADMVIMGHHSRPLLAVEMLGSVTLRVIPRAGCAVLVVRD